MAVFSATDQGARAGSFTVSAAGLRSRAMVVVQAGQDLPAGMVVGKVTASGKIVAWDPAAVDGSESVHGILFAATDAGAGDQKAVVVTRSAEANWAELRWREDVTGPDMVAARTALLSKKLVNRNSIPA